MNSRHRQRLQALVKPYQRQIDLDVFPEEKAETLTIQAMAEYIFLDFGGFMDTNEDGVEYEVENSLENRKRLLSIPDLRSVIEGLSRERATFAVALREETAGNSESSSSGPSSGDQPCNDPTSSDESSEGSQPLSGTSVPDSTLTSPGFESASFS
jgi:hypothetical protein